MRDAVEDFMIRPHVHVKAARTEEAMKHPECPWLDIAYEELEKGVKEVPGVVANPRIVEYHSVTTLKSTSDETPWCAAFACWCLEKAGIRSPRSARARDFLSWGTQCDAKVGAIAVFSRGSNPSSGHVAFTVQTDPDYVHVIGGNQGDKVSHAKFPRSRVLGFRWP